MAFGLDAGISRETSYTVQTAQKTDEVGSITEMETFVERVRTEGDDVVGIGDQGFRLVEGDSGQDTLRLFWCDLETGEKTLVFVRRVRTVDELALCFRNGALPEDDRDWVMILETIDKVQRELEGRFPALVLASAEENGDEPDDGLPRRGELWRFLALAASSMPADIAEFEVNPLVWSAEGPVALDALVRLASPVAVPPPPRRWFGPPRGSGGTAGAAAPSPLRPGLRWR